MKLTKSLKERHQPLSAEATGGRFTARVGFVFGSVTSVAANVLAARIPPPHAGPRWSPNVATEIGAAVWPLILLLAVEILARVRWPHLWQWGLAKFGGAGTVALGSAVISYGHIRTVLASWNYTPTGAGVGPLVVDGLMVISGFALLALSHQPSVTRAASLVSGTEDTVNTVPPTQDSDTDTPANTSSVPVAAQPVARSRKAAAHKTNESRRTSREEYLSRARAAHREGVVVTPAWVREVVPGISRGTSQVVSDLLKAELATPHITHDTVTAVDLNGRAA